MAWPFAGQVGEASSGPQHHDGGRRQRGATCTAPTAHSCTSYRGVDRSPDRKWM